MLINKSSVNASLRSGDLSSDFYNAALKRGKIAIDIETTGLDSKRNKIAICQVALGSESIEVVREMARPGRLISLIEDAQVVKVFHQALFDLSFMYYTWSVRPRNIKCTKIASKLLARKKWHRTTLKATVKRYLDVDLNKNARMSRWTNMHLSGRQLDYAVGDVRYLLPLIKKLEIELERRGMIELARECFCHITTRLQLEAIGVGDVFKY